MIMEDKQARDLRVFALKAQLRQAKSELRRSERELIKERLKNAAYMGKMRVLLLRSFRVVTQARQWVNANAFGEGDSDIAWLNLYKSICDWDEEVKDQIDEEI